MRPDLMVELNGVLALAGGALQWLRAFAKVKDAFVFPVGFMIAIGLWALAVDWKAAQDWQAFTLHNILIVGGFVSSLFGGTFGAEKMAAAAVGAGANPQNPFIPHTDSK